MKPSERLRLVEVLMTRRHWVPPVKEFRCSAKTLLPHLLELLDDFLILAEVRLVRSVHTCRTHAHTHTHYEERSSWKDSDCLSCIESSPGLESSVFRFLSFLTFICLVISPEEHTSRHKTSHGEFEQIKCAVVNNLKPFNFRNGFQKLRK